MKSLIGFLMLTHVSFVMAASDISESDVGEYFTPSQDRASVYYRLSSPNGNLVLQDKVPGGPISKIYCLSGCEYKKATTTEIEGFFPKHLRQGMDLACIKNSAWAFCRANPRTSPNTNMYALIALFANPPAFLPLMRVPNEQPSNTTLQGTPASGRP